MLNHSGLEEMTEAISKSFCQLGIGQTMMTRKSGGLMASVEQQTFDVDLPRMEFVGGCNMRSCAREGRYLLHQVVQFG